MSNQSDSHILEIKNTSVMAMRLVVKTTDYSAVAEAIERKMAQAGDFFRGESIIIDAYGIVQPLPWDKLVPLLKGYGLNILGIYTNERLLPGAIEAGLSPINLTAANSKTASQASSPAPSSSTIAAAPSKTATAPAASTASSSKPPAAQAGGAQPTMVIKRQLRSGQRIYANDSDLIVIGSVGHGAEIVADGNIHVYGSLFGRAIAGAKGDSSARIFTSHLDPELVAIAGIYRLFDADFKPAGLRKAVIVELEDDTLSFNEIST